jgi:serine phosphatase RsbU (regulator of sigma subunit)/tetratricopeptide (TPR) repeat protein
MKKINLIVSFLFAATFLHGQIHMADSLVAHLGEMKDDTTKVKKLLGIWVIYDNASMLDKAMIYSKEAYDLAVNLNNNKQIADAANCVGNTAIDEGAYPMALDYYMKELKAAQECNSKYFIANATCNIGLVYFSENDFQQALDYYKKALPMDEELHDSSNITAATTDIGTVYFQRKDYTNAKKYFTMSLNIDRKRKFTSAISGDLENMGDVYLNQNKYDSALSYLMESLKISSANNYLLQIIADKTNIGQTYLGMNKQNEGTKYLTEAYRLADSIHSLDNVKGTSESLSKLYAKNKDWQKAYEYFQRYFSSKDSLVNETKSKEIGKLEVKSGYDKQLVLQKAEIDKKEAIANAESKGQKIIIGFVVAIALTVAIIAIIIFRSLKVTRKQKEIIEVQKNEVEEKKMLVEEKNTQILDSITYAKHLQDAILPPLGEIKRYLEESFVLYKPKDIVAGDFYWMEQAGESTLIAACDCTGHGVPGAMVSVVCSNALNRTVKEFGITEPGKILDKTRELVLETFEKSEGEIKDGMDISLCSIDRRTRKIKWAGAYNPLLYVHNSELRELMPDKQPIGEVDNPKLFTTHDLTLQQGDVIYLLTDGYADQFGGPKGKKYKSKQLEGKLGAIMGKSMEEQKEILDKEFENWKDMLEQTDDVCLIGIRV